MNTPNVNFASNVLATFLTVAISVYLWVQYLAWSAPLVLALLLLGTLYHQNRLYQTQADILQAIRVLNYKIDRATGSNYVMNVIASLRAILVDNMDDFKAEIVRLADGGNVATINRLTAQLRKEELAQHREATLRRKALEELQQMKKALEEETMQRRNAEGRVASYQRMSDRWSRIAREDKQKLEASRLPKLRGELTSASSDIEKTHLKVR